MRNYLTGCVRVDGNGTVSSPACALAILNVRCHSGHQQSPWRDHCSRFLFSFYSACPQTHQQGKAKRYFCTDTVSWLMQTEKSLVPCYRGVSVHLCIFMSSKLIFLFQAGMIRTEKEEFYIEPLERGDGVMEKEEEEGGGRTHIIYRSSAVKKAPIGSAAADFHSRGQSVVPSVLLYSPLL